MNPLRPLLALACMLATAAAARAQTVITSLPYTITASGTYVLNSNFNSSLTSGNLITINASNVTVDFQDHYISGPVNNPNQSTVGVYAVGRSNLTIKNGTVAFCAIGIDLEGDGNTMTNSVDHRVDNMRTTYCYQFGIYVLSSPSSRITNCQVSQIGYDAPGSAVGIYAGTPGMLVSGNVVNGTTVTNTFGIYAISGTLVRQNAISNVRIGVLNGKYQDNLTSDCTTPFFGGVDAGGNN